MEDQGELIAANKPAENNDVTDRPEIEPARKQLVAEWLEKIEQAREYWEPCWKRMRQCRKLAAVGAEKGWADRDAYTVPLAPRHINVAVATLYAKDPRAYVQRRKRLMHTVWDGTPQQFTDAMNASMMGDPNAVGLAQAIIQDVEQAKQYDLMVDRMGKTLVCLWDYFTSEQRASFKAQMKALVRRAKIDGVGHVRLGFQRTLGKDPDVSAEIADMASKIQGIEAGLACMAEGEEGYDENSAAYEALKLNMQDLQSREEIVLREGPVFAFPKTEKVIVDPGVQHYKTLVGAEWVAYEFDLTPAKVRELYDVSLKDGDFTKFYPKKSTKSGRQIKDEKRVLARVYEVECLADNTSFVVVEGYPDFVVEPHNPNVRIERFFTVFPLVFNEVEDDEFKIPPSDVWLMRHPQAEYNRSREALRQHRLSNQPRWASAAGTLEEKDKELLASGPPHSLLELQGLIPGEKLENKLQRVPVVNIDPNQYLVEDVYRDVQRAVGSQEANLGGLSKDVSATQSSISEQTRLTGVSDNVDELDDLLSELARSTGQLMLLELTKETVVEIVGPGAVWPEQAISREELNKELMLTLRAGSSGRPNAAAEVAKLERAVPYLLQLPGINPEPLARKYAELLDIDIDELYAAGVPSIQAINSMMAKQAAGGVAGGAGKENPNAQGDKGSQNQESTQRNEPGAQPAHPAPNSGPGIQQNQG